jgi:hypothetical protein
LVCSTKIYKYVHANKKSVIWLNSPNEIAAKIKYGLNNSVEIVANAQNGLWLWGKILLKLLSKFEQ